MRTMMWLTSSAGFKPKRSQRELTQVGEEGERWPHELFLRGFTRIYTHI